MAMIPADAYPSQIVASDPAYPYGKARNVTSPGDGTGTPLEKDWVNDHFGFQQALLVAAGITPSGTPDQVGASQYLEALKTLLVMTIGVANWTVRDPAGAISDNFAGVASDGNGTLVAVGAAGTIQSSSDGGITWTARTAAGSYVGAFAGIAFGAGLFVAVGSGPEIQTSPDGITWTQQTVGGTGGTNAFGIAFGAGLFVSVWGTGGVIRTSPDGITWTQQTGAGATTAGAGYGDGLYVTGGGSGGIQTSPDGITWTLRTADASYASTFWGHAYGNGLHVLVGNSGEIQTSPDGITWTHRDSPVAENLRSIVFAAGLFAACGESSSAILVSPDGITWTSTLSPAPAAGDLHGIGFDGQGFVAVGAAAAIITSLRALGV